jgi:hypothetical protein
MEIKKKLIKNKEAIKLAFALAAGLLGFPIINLTLKLFAFVQYVFFGYVY